MVEEIKTCKVYCTYFGTRRGKQSASPSNADEAYAVFRKNIENDMVLDCGVKNMDILIVNNYSNQITSECQAYLNSLNNVETSFGKIIVLERENHGGSLGAYSYAFSKFEDVYDYWFFIEDDIKMIYPKYYEMIINEFNSDDKLGFLSFTLINDENDKNLAHVSGGFGASRKEILKKIKNKYGKLPYDTGINLTNYARVGQSELYFTNCYLKLGYKIKIPDNQEIVTLADNWKEFPPHVKWQNIKKFNLENKKYLYHLGL